MLRCTRNDRRLSHSDRLTCIILYDIVQRPIEPFIRSLFSRGGAGAHIFKELNINERIRAREVRLIGDTGEQVGIVPVKDALQMARERNTDLVEVAPTATPPVCRLMDYGKYKYAQIKKERQGRRTQKATQVREIRLRPKISPHDVESKIRLALRLLGEGNKVKVFVIFRGREFAHPELGWKLLQSVAESLKDKATLERPPSNEGGRINFIVAPLPAKQAKEAKPAPKEAKPVSNEPKPTIKEPVNA